GFETTRFQLTTAGGTVVNLSTAGLTGGGHVLTFEGIDLTSAGSMKQLLVLDLTSAGIGANGAFAGVGGARALAAALAGDGETTASTTGAGGGFIDVGSAAANANGTVTANLTIGTGASLSATSIEVRTESHLELNATADGDGVGFVSLGRAEAYTTGRNNSTLTIEDGAVLTATGLLKVQSETDTDVDASASSDKTGLGSGVTVRARADGDYTTKVLVNGDLTAGSIDIDAKTTVDAEVSAKADADGFGADGDANDTGGMGARIGRNDSRTTVEIGAGAVLVAGTVDIRSDTNGRAHAYGETDSDAVGADADARADAIARGTTEVIVRALAQITGHSLVKLAAEQSRLEVTAHSSADCSCLGGDTDSNATDDAQTVSRVVGEKDAFFRTADLQVFSLANNITISRTRDKDGGAFDGGSRGGDETKDVRLEIDWESTAILLGEPNPEIEIDASGTVVKLVNITGYDGAGSPLVVGGTVGAGDITLDDIIYDQGGNVLFSANDVGDNGPNSEIWGNAAIFDFQETWDHVTIVNRSAHDIYVMDIDVVKPVSSNQIQIDVMNIPDDQTPPPSSSFRVDDVAKGDRFHFEIIHSYIETVVAITADQASGTDWDVKLNGVIHNAIGQTYITAANGDIEYSNSKTNPGGYANGTDQLIRTNELYLDALGSAGFHTDPTDRTPVNVELIESDYTDTGEPLDPVNDPYRRTPRGTFTSGKPILTRLIVIEAAAGDDVVLTVASHRHADATRAAGDDFVITFGPVAAGDDIDIFVLDSIDRTTPGGPGTTHIHRADNGADLSPHDVHRFWRPDCALSHHGSAPCPYYELGNFATGDTAVLGNYLFSPGAENYPTMTVGGTIDSGDRPTGSTAYLAAGDFVSVRHLTGGPISYTGIVNADSNGDGTGSVVLLTNSFVNAEERIGNLQVDDISSSAGDVHIWALGRILDWEDDAQSAPDPIGTFTASTPTTGTDVRGVDVTMFAGLAGLVGGIGNGGNFLEIDVDVLNGNGVLNAFDIWAGSTPGIFLAETSGDLEIDTVWTTDDVSMYTIDGSINDARSNGAGDDEVNVLGQTIGLDANDYEASPNGFGGPNTNASIGNPNGANDLEIDSSRGGVEDVSLEADNSIFVTEADAKVVHNENVTAAAALDALPTLETDPFSTLRLVLARAWSGDIRITVREEVELPEDDDLRLLQGGDFQRAEDELLDIPSGTVIARLGYVLLRVGDDVDLHQNSRTLAGESIDIYGDAAAAALAPAERDPGYGADMVLRGRIIAGCINPGVLSCDPDTTPTGDLADLWLTQIWGYDDIDHIDIGDATGAPTVADELLDPGDPGYIFIGSKTVARGSDDPVTAGDVGHDPSVADGEDVFTVWFLQTADVLAAPVQLAEGAVSTPAAGHSLTLDGQADTDYYRIYTTGSRFSERNYVINVLDTGAPDDGADELDIYGRDNHDPAYSGYETGTTTRNPNDDLFLLRAVRCIDTDGIYGVTDPDTLVPTTCESPTEAADHPAFVALLHGDAEGYRSREVGDETSSFVQRIHYDAALNGRLSVYGFAGNDQFFVDDNSAVTTLDGGEGNDLF
ncbi:MAG: hypothetical protein ACRDPR_16545, partial [Nocardioidaceae bacterium]